MSDLPTLRARVEAAQVEVREKAVANVDAAHGYTAEFAPHYATHVMEYGEEEARLRGLFGVTLAADLLAFAESQAEQLAYHKLLISVMESPNAQCWEPNAEDGSVRIRSRIVGFVLRSLAQSCIEYGGENNLAVTMGPSNEDVELDGWRWQIHVTKPGAMTPTEQHDATKARLMGVERERDEARAKLAALNGAAIRLTVTPATLRRAELLGWTPGDSDVLEWALGLLESDDPEGVARRSALVNAGHDTHCAARMVWGDGVCTCKKDAKGSAS